MAQPQAKVQRNSLKGIAIFAGLSPESVERIEWRTAWKRYVPGEPILSYLDKSDDVFFLTLGEVRVTIYSTVGKAVSFREIAAGEIFGERSMAAHARTVWKRARIARLPRCQVLRSASCFRPSLGSQMPYCRGSPRPFAR